MSRPGPVESRILESLALVALVRPRVGAGVALRTLETRVTPEGGPTIVLLHGRGHSATTWARWLPGLSPRARVVALDLPGFGHSGARALRDRSQEGALAWFVDPVEEVLSEEEPVVLVGHSLGGLVALEVALRRRVRVLALVLIGAMGLGPVMLPGARLYLRLGPERLARWSRSLGRSGAGLSEPTGDADLAALRAELYSVRGGRPLPKQAFDILAPLLGPVFHRGDRLGEIAVPTLLLWGERDEAFPLPVALAAAPRIPGARLEVLPAGHSPHLERPERCLELVGDFLRRSSV